MPKLVPDANWLLTRPKIYLTISCISFGLIHTQSIMVLIRLNT